MGNDNAMIDGAESRAESRLPAAYQEYEFNIGEYFAIIRSKLWKIFLVSFLVGLVTLVVMFLMPNIYQSTAIITPAIDEKRPNPAFGALVSFGIEVGGPSRVEDLETLFKSNDLAVRVFRKFNLWPILLGDRYDLETGKVKDSWKNKIFGWGEKPKPLGDWDAIRAAKDRLKVSVNKKSGTVSVSFESPSAEGSAEIVKHFLNEGKNRLQEEALDRAIKNKKFIEEQIGKTVDALTRDRLYSLYGQEVEHEMMARNREQFGFRVIDAPRVPDRKIKPLRGQGLMLAVLLSFFFGCIFFVVRGTAETKKSRNPDPTGTS